MTPLLIPCSEFIALHKSIGAMRQTLEEIAGGRISKQQMVMYANNALKLVQKYEKEEKENQ